MLVKSIKDFRTFYKEKIKQTQENNRNEHFVGHSIELEGKTIFGFFELFHGDKKDINKFIKPFLDLALDSQAVYEFLQNAYDAEATVFVFLVNEEYLFVFNNGKKFTFEGIRSILNIGQSTKESKSNIGKFGIGFKIVHRLLGESDGQKELNDYFGPVIFSWNKYSDIQQLADCMCAPTISAETPFFSYNNQDKVYVESDNNPWLFKILFTNFPLGYQEPFYDLNYHEKNNIFSYQDLIDLSTITRKFLFDSGEFSDLELKEGTIIFLRLGANKSSSILSDTAKTTIHRSLNFLNKSNTGHKALDKIYVQSLENSVSNDKYEIENFIITRQDRDYDIILADAAESDKPETIEIMVQYPKDISDLFLKSEPNLYLYFPMSEEHLQLNFAIHCNAFHNQSSRTGIDFNSPRNINILDTFCRRLISQLEKLKVNDPGRFCLIFNAIIFSDRASSVNKSWAVDNIYNPLMSYCRSNIPSSEGNYFSKERIRIKKTSLSIKPSDFGVTSFEWFFSEEEELVKQAINSNKLAISSAGIFDLLLSTSNLDCVNEWLNKNSKYLTIFKQELDSQIGNINNYWANNIIVNLLFSTKFLDFLDGKLYSLSDINDKPTHIIIDENYRDILNFLIKCGFTVFFIQSDKYRHIYEFFSYYHEHLKNRNKFITFFSRGLEDREIFITKDELDALLNFMKDLSVPIFDCLKIIKYNDGYNLSKYESGTYLFNTTNKQKLLKDYILKNFSAKYFYIDDDVISLVSNRSGLLTDNNLYETIMKEQYVHSELIDAIIEADSNETKTKFVSSINKLVLEPEKVYNSSSYEHKVLDMSKHLGTENIKEKIEIIISNDKTIALANISHHNQVVFKDKDTGEEYTLQLSKIIPIYSESTELIEKIIRSFPDMKMEELRNQIFEVGKAKDKDSIIREMSKFLENAHQLAFLALYLKYKGNNKINITDYSVINAFETKVIMNCNRKYYTNCINYIDPFSLLAPIYKEIEVILRISDLKPNFDNPCFQIVSKPFLKEGVYICSPLKYDLKCDSVCQKEFINDWFIEYHNNNQNIHSLSIDETIWNNNSQVQIEYNINNKKYFLGFEPELCIYPSEYAIESEKLPKWVLDWIDTDNSYLKLNFLALLGLNTESSDLVHLRKVIKTGLGNSSLDKVEHLGLLNKGYLERCLLYAMHNKIEFIEDSTSLSFIKSIYHHINIVSDIPLLLIKSVDDNGKIHYDVRDVNQIKKIWRINQEDLQDTLNFIKRIVELLNNRNELLLDYRTFPEESSFLKNVDSLEYDITLNTGHKFTEYNKNYYKLWKERLKGKFTIYQSNDPTVKSLEYQYSLMGEELFCKYENEIDINDHGSIYFINNGIILEELLKKIVGKGTFTQAHLDLLIQLKRNEPEEIRKQYDIEFEPINDYNIQEYIRINASNFPEGEVKSFEDKLVELINAQHSKWKSYIYHFTHLENAVKIINSKKIKSRNSASFKDSAGQSFIQNTQEKIKNFARFYFRPKTPTQYYNERLGKTTKLGDLPQCPVPIFFKFSLEEVLKSHKGRCYISNGNLRHYPITNYGNTYDFLRQVNFNNLYSEYGDCDVRTYLNASQQEFIVERELDFSMIKDYKIICPDEHSWSSLLSLIEAHSVDSQSIIIDRSYYYGDNPTININVEADKLSVSKPYSIIPGKLLVKTEINIGEKTVGQEIETDDGVKISSPDNPNVKIFYMNTITGTKWLIFYKRINMSIQLH